MSAGSSDNARPIGSEEGERIAVMCHGGGSGSTRAAICLAAALVRRGRKVLLVTLGPTRWATPAGVRHAVLRIDRPAPSRLDARWEGPTVKSIARALATICRRESIGVLHFHYGLPFAAIGALVQAILGQAAPSIVVTLHGSDVTTAVRDQVVRRLLRRTLPCAGAVSTVSAAYAEKVVTVLGGISSPLVVPNFLPDDWPIAPRRSRPRGRPPTIIHVSNFRAVKDMRGVARIFLAVRRRLRCRLLLVGDGPDRRWMRSLLGRRAADVDVLGFRQDMPILLRKADVLLLASHEESFSLASLEAMAAGVPVIAPRVGGLPEVVGEGVGGVLYHPGRTADGAARLAALLLTPIRRRRLGETARRRASRFTEADAVARYEQLYRLALARRAVAMAKLP